jgi:hypothetical protein
MIFLNYKHLDDFFQISGNTVKPTDGINSAEAMLCVQTRRNLNVKKTIRVIAKIVPTYVSRELVLTCDNSRRKFSPLQFKEDRLITNVQLRVAEAFGSDFARDLVLLDKSFPNVSGGTCMNFAYSGIRNLVYSEPVAGTKLPLWHIGGAWNGENVESLFICPTVRPQNPTEAEIVRLSLSQIASLPEITYVPEDSIPWSLREFVETGGIELSVGGITVKSSVVENTSKEAMTIVFVEKDNAK